MLTQDDETEVWLNEDGFPDDDIAMPADEQPCHSRPKLIEAYLTFLFMWQNIFRVSDVGMGVLLSFIALFVLLLGKSFGLESLKSLGSVLPKSVYSARKLLGRNLDHFLKFIGAQNVQHCMNLISVS